VKLEWTQLAIEDREAVFDHISAENFPASLALDKVFQQKAAILESHPRAGRVGRVQGTRELVAHPHYVLVYDILPDCVRILRVRHTSRKWPPGPGRARRSTSKRSRK
jgi:toxin ParE1/3/4